MLELDFQWSQRQLDDDQWSPLFLAAAVSCVLEEARDTYRSQPQNRTWNCLSVVLGYHVGWIDEDFVSGAAIV